MHFDDLARQLTEVAQGNGKCHYAAIHSIEDGTCLGKHPTKMPQSKPDEIAALHKAFRDPTVLYSSGITLMETKFTYVKVEGSTLLGRTTNLSCLVWKTEKELIVCIYPSDELTKLVYKNCSSIAQKLNV